MDDDSRVRLSPVLVAAVPLLYLLASSLLDRWVDTLSQSAWHRAWWPAVLAAFAAVFVPTTAWIARRPGPQWMRTTVLNVAVGHALAALLIYSRAIHALGQPRTRQGQLQFDVPRLPRSEFELVRDGVLTVLAAAVVASLLAVPLGAAVRRLPPRPAARDR